MLAHGAAAQRGDGETLRRRLRSEPAAVRRGEEKEDIEAWKRCFGKAGTLLSAVFPAKVAKLGVATRAEKRQFPTAPLESSTAEDSDTKHETCQIVGAIRTPCYCQ